MLLRKCLVISAVLVLAACGGGGSTAPTSTAPTVVTTPAPTGSTATASIGISAPDPTTGDYGQGGHDGASSFSPGTVTVAVGSTVTWSNDDVTAHTTTASGGAWNTTLTPGATFSRVFPTAGTFDYKCTIHPSMSGSVIVK